MKRTTVQALCLLFALWITLPPEDGAYGTPLSEFFFNRIVLFFWFLYGYPPALVAFVVSAGRQVDGAELVVHAAGAADGPVVVRAHCWTGSQHTWAPVSKLTSCQRSPVSSETRRPVCSATNSRVRSRRPSAQRRPQGHRSPVRSVSGRFACQWLHPSTLLGLMTAGGVALPRRSSS